MPIRRPTDPREAAEAAFRKVVAPPPAAAPAAPRRAAVPGAKTQVTLRIDQAILDHFQHDGPGWQERINAALRQAIGATAGETIAAEDLNASNDE
jgi:uncharacterized protein (DUF4415 family)